jgi:radical SAM protein with 4Fe4S-binding SPASM domain
VNVVKINDKNSDWMTSQYEIIIKEFQKAYKLSKSYGIMLKLPDHLGKNPVNEGISNKSCKFNCKNPWKEIYIRYNGDLTVCNMLNPYIYGNCQNYSFIEIWNGLNAELFRSFVNTKYKHYYCKDCYYLV